VQTNLTNVKYLFFVFLNAGTFLYAQSVVDGTTGTRTEKPIIFEISACQAETIYFRTQTSDSAWFAENADMSIVSSNLFHSVNNNTGKWKFSSLVEKVTDPTADTIKVRQFVLRRDTPDGEEKFLYYYDGVQSFTMYSVDTEVVSLTRLKMDDYFDIAKDYFDQAINTPFKM
jgi:hypothetical protein